MIHDSNPLEGHIAELIELLKIHDVSSKPIQEFLDRFQGTGYFSEIQSVLDVKELLDAGLIVVPKV